MRYSEVTAPTHENFEAQCPYCTFWNTFNRATELGDDDRVDGMVRPCKSPDCGREFYLTNDLANPTYSRLLLDAESSIQQCRFGQGIVTLTTSIEAFFDHALHELLAWKLLAQVESVHGAAEAANAVAAAIDRQIAKSAYEELRNAFIHVVLAGPVTSLIQAAQVAAGLNKTTPTDAAIKNLPDTELRRVILLLKASRVHVVRNAVTHHTTYRPTEREANELLQEVKDIIWTLVFGLDIFEESFAI